MKTYIKNLFLLPALMAGLGLILAGRVTAQTFTTLHSFTARNNSTNSDGATPHAGLILSGNTVYGTARIGGSSGNGTVFAVNTDGTAFTNLHSFTYSDGANPYGGLTLSGNTLYGTARFGGSSDNGTVFAVNTNGTGFTTLHSFTATPDFTNSDGAHPEGGLILSGNTLYGTAHNSGSSGAGTVFKVNTDGTGFTTLHSFTAIPPYPGPYINSDGAHPEGDLILSGNTLYGTTYEGGSPGAGTVFAVNTDGTGFTNLHSFTARVYDSATGAYTNSDGAHPEGGLILSGNALYGTAAYGGSSGNGTVFTVNTDGTGFTTLYSFTAIFGPYPSTNSEGAVPFAGLLLSGNTLYGTAVVGGSSGYGTVFKVNTDGSGFTNLHSFNSSDGANPFAELILSGNTLYGTARIGGSSGNGTVFSLSLGSVSAPQLTIIRSGAYVILTWPTNAVGFQLESATNLSDNNAWSAVTNSVVIVGDQNTVAMAASGVSKFYRLKQQ